MTRGLEKALAAVRHDNRATVMSAAEIEAHRVFLTGLGITPQEIDLTINVIHSTLRGDEVAMPDYIIPLMPATWVRDYVEGDRRQYERRPHLWSTADRSWFTQRASFYDLAAIVMDLRVRQGDGAAVGAADAVRAHAGFLRAFQGHEPGPEASALPIAP
ncbi:hypothetical protein ACRQ1B_29020 [Rhizobium panacihumi]|uniref:hypothetical protein n=1 Tax=Rhizobium panacihumi TaxID=2008450 RepID=UPI003D7BC815